MNKRSRKTFTIAVVASLVAVVAVWGYLAWDRIGPALGVAPPVKEPTWWEYLFGTAEAGSPAFDSRDNMQLSLAEQRPGVVRSIQRAAIEESVSGIPGVGLAG